MTEESNSNKDFNKSNLTALEIKNYLSDLLDADPFDITAFKALVDHFNEKTEFQKDYKDCFITVERIYRKHGNLRVLHYDGTDKMMFEYQFLG